MNRIGAWLEGREVVVRTWAPEHKELVLQLYAADGKTLAERAPMSSEPGGFFVARAPARDPFLYKVVLDGAGPFPDPWSRAQPFGVHGPSAAVSSEFAWTDERWRGIPAADLVLYEVHVGTATKRGTFDALIPLLPDLRSLGITALELLPVASFPGRWNWGYDGVSLFAPAQPYGGPQALKQLINAAHDQGLGVIIDAVYNHFGPDGNYLGCYSKKYFTGKEHTPWGDAVNYAEPVVRELALSNAQMWIEEFHADGLRLDAVHEIKDSTLLKELVQRSRAAAANRTVVIMAEDDRNERALITESGLDGLWADDSHHQLRRAFAGDSDGYYQDFSGTTEDIATTLNEGWFFTGQHSKNLKRNRGTRGIELPPSAFIHCIQNHDQIGNRPAGNRLTEDVSPAAFRAMSATLLFLPYTPLIYAGQEWGTKTPFIYFTDHEPGLGKQITEGRRKEFASFAHWAGTEVPDPQAEETFRRCVLDWSERTRPEHSGTLALYRALLELRRSLPSTREGFKARAVNADVFSVDRGPYQLVVRIRGETPLPTSCVLHTDEKRFGGNGAVIGSGSCAVIVAR